MTTRLSDLAIDALIALSIALAFIIDEFFVPDSEFSSAPFAIPIVIAAARPDRRIMYVTVVACLVAASVAATKERVMTSVTLLHLSSILIVGILGLLLQGQRRTTIQQAQETDEARRRLLDLLNSMTDAFFAIDRSWRVTFINPEAAKLIRELIHVEPPSLLGRGIWTAFPPSMLEGIEDDLRRAMERREAVSFVAPNEDLHAWFDVRVYPTEEGLSVYVRNVTARVRAEIERQQLFEQERLARAQAAADRARIQTILRSAANAIVYVDAATGHVTVNPAATHLFGHPFNAKDHLPQLVDQLRHPNGQPLSPDEAPSRLALSGYSITNQEIIVVRPDGSQTPVLESATPVRGGDDAAIGAVLVFQDISAIKDLERVREEWTTVVAHDLRQPITTISGYASLLARELAKHPHPDVEERAIEHVLTAARSLSQMVGDLLDVSRIETRRLRIERQEVDLLALTCSVVERMAEVTGGHPVVVEIHGDLPSLWIDPTRIEQVLANLLSNAAKYSFPDTEIDVNLERQGNNAVIAIVNQGPGIPPSELGRLFTRFYRTREAQTQRVAGLGLGLYIAKGLVEAHGGRIWAESVPGKITTFRFSLPIETGSTP